MDAQVRPVLRVRGRIRVPGDKSLSHRALMLGALACGESVVHDLAPGADVRSTARCLRALGISVQLERGHGPEGVTARVQGGGLFGLLSPSAPLDAGNSGTTMRLLAGVLAGQPFECVLTGDESLRRRPMGRIIEPLTQMGASIESAEGRAPLRIRGGRLRGIRYELPVPSAQVKSCVLLAGLFAEGETTVVEPVPTRDHTERLLRRQGAAIERSGREITVRPGSELRPLRMRVPGDPSSAAFWVAAATLLPDSELVIRDVGLNPTRIGFFQALQRMGACISLQNVHEEAGEPVGDLIVRGVAPLPLKALEVTGSELPALVDEVPLLTVVATQAEGTTVVRDAEELRVKETDRLRAVAENLRRMGAEVEELPDGLRIPGPQALQGARLPSYGDHRIVMAFAVAGLVARGDTILEGAEWADVSYPGFFQVLSQIAETERV